MPRARNQARTRWIGLVRFAVPAVALPSCMLLVGAVQEAVWDDATVIHAGGGTLLLDRAVDQAISETPATRANMRRIGLKQACAISAVARRQAVAAEAGAFLPALVTAMRAQIPSQRLTGRAFSAFTGASLGRYKARVVAALERDAAPIYVRAKTDALAQFEHEAEASPAISGDWADIFVDWDLSTASALSAACMQYGLSDPAMGKRAFDMFYQRKETH